MNLGGGVSDMGLCWPLTDWVKDGIIGLSFTALLIIVIYVLLVLDIGYKLDWP